MPKFFLSFIGTSGKAIIVAEQQVSHVDEAGSVDVDVVFEHENVNGFVDHEIEIGYENEMYFEHDDEPENFDGNSPSLGDH